MGIFKPTNQTLGDLWVLKPSYSLLTRFASQFINFEGHEPPLNQLRLEFFLHMFIIYLKETFWGVKLNNFEVFFFGTP